MIKLGTAWGLLLEKEAAKSGTARRVWGHLTNWENSPVLKSIRADIEAGKAMRRAERTRKRLPGGMLPSEHQARAVDLSPLANL